jgi:hypothetical protein
VNLDKVSVYYRAATSYFALAIHADGAAEQIVVPYRPAKLHLHTSHVSCTGDDGRCMLSPLRFNFLIFCLQSKLFLR